MKSSDHATASLGKGITTFRIGSTELKRWMHQNRAEYTGDIIVGCLLDNFVLECKRGFAAVYEHYLNEWTSDYLIEFEAGDAETVWKRWDEFCARCEDQT